MESSDPDIEVGPLKIWIRGRAFPEAQDFWDGNALRITASCEPIRVDGVFFMVSDVIKLLQACREAHQSIHGKIEFAPLEPDVRFTLESSDTLGHFHGHTTLTLDHMRERHEYWFGIEQSYLPKIIQQCERVLDAYPVRDPERHL